MTKTHPDGYLALPRTGSGPGVLVLHTWWGLNDVIKSVCDRLAEEGFHAYAPDLFRGQIARTVAEAEGLSGQYEGETALSAALLGLDQLSQRLQPPKSKIAVVGFSFGAYYSIQLSVLHPQQVRSVVLFYGTGDGEFSQARASYLGHFADLDPYEPPENVEWLEGALKEAGRPVSFYRYAGVGHWFFETDRQDAYNQPAAQLAWERTLSFLKDTIGKPG